MKRKAKSEDKLRLCIHSGCKAESKSAGYCRAHYIANWKHIKFNNQIKAEKRLNNYVDRLVKKYPDAYLEKIKEGLESEEKFKDSIQELEMDEESSTRETESEYLERLSRSLKIGND